METPALIAVSGFATVLAATAWLAPSLLPGLIGALLALGGIVLACRHLTAAWVGWLLVTGLSLEMAVADVIGPEAFQPTIAAVKAAEIGLVVLTILRLGLVPDLFNPVWAFAVMAATGVVAGTHPDLTLPEAARSLIGDITPFLLFFCVKPAGWGAAMRRAVTLAPALSVALGTMLDLAGLASGVFGEWRPAPGGAWPSGVPGGCLSAGHLCRIDPLAAHRRLARGRADRRQPGHPVPDRRPRARRLCRRRHRRQPVAWRPAPPCHAPIGWC